MSKAYKKDGKFYLEPDPVLTARSTGKADREKTKNKTDRSGSKRNPRPCIDQVGRARREADRSQYDDNRTVNRTVNGQEGTLWITIGDELNPRAKSYP